MNMRIDESDIYDIQIETIYGDTCNGCDQGFGDFDVNIDEVTTQKDDIKIEISGTCVCFGYHNDIPCTFDGTLTMDESDFAYEYTHASEYGDKYIEFSGNIGISAVPNENEDEDEDDEYEDDYYPPEEYDIKAKVYLSNLDL